MKFNKEIQIGLLVIVSIVALVVGVRFMQGKGIFETEKSMFVLYDNTEGLKSGAPVLLNGVRVGSVADIKLLDNNRIGVKLFVNNKVKVPSGSTAELASLSMISGDKMVKLNLASDNNSFLKDQDTLLSRKASSLLTDISSEATPVIKNVNKAVESIDSLTNSVTSILDIQTKASIQSSVRNADRTLSEVALLSRAINQQTVALARIMQNLEQFTANMNDNNKKINTIMSNAEVASSTISGPELKETMVALKNAATNLNHTLQKVNSKEGSLGMLTQDRALYDNLSKTSKSIGELLTDLKKRPGRYINVSVFGAKHRYQD